MKAIARPLLASAVVAAGALVPASPAHALCTAQLNSAPAGHVSSCSTYAHGWAVVGVTGVTDYTASCGFYSRSGTIGTNAVQGSFPTGGCSATLTLRARTSGTTAYGVM